MQKLIQFPNLWKNIYYFKGNHKYQGVDIVDTLFWNIFEKSGDINAFLAYKDFNELKKDKCNDNKHY